MNKLAAEDSKKFILARKAQRKETAILVSYIINTSGAAKTRKSPDEVYKSMPIEDEEDIQEREKIQGPRRHYRGSLKSQFEQHAKWLEEQQEEDGGNL